jgi:competence protein ComEC
MAGCLTALRLLGAIPILIGLVIAGVSTRPDMLVSRSGGNVALRAHDGKLSFSSARRARFDAEIWLRADGDTRDIAAAISRDQSVFSCSAGSCVADLAGQGTRVTVLSSSPQGQGPCPKADIVVTPAGDVPDCARAERLKLSARYLQRSGAVAIRFGRGKWTVETVAAKRGQRPWVAAVKQQPEAGSNQ